MCSELCTISNISSHKSIQPYKYCHTAATFSYNIFYELDQTILYKLPFKSDLKSSVS